MADQALACQALKEVAKGTGEPSPSASGGRDGSRPPRRSASAGLVGPWASTARPSAREPTLAADDQALRAALREIAADRREVGPLQAVALGPTEAVVLSYRRAHDQLLVETGRSTASACAPPGARGGPQGPRAGAQAPPPRRCGVSTWGVRRGRVLSRSIAFRAAGRPRTRAHPGPRLLAQPDRDLLLDHPTQGPSRPTTSTTWPNSPGASTTSNATTPDSPSPSRAPHQPATGSRRWILLSAATAAAVGIAAVFVVAGASSRSHGSHAETSPLHAHSSHRGPASSPGTESAGTQSGLSVRVLPYTSPNEPTNFTTYSVGPRFEGMAVTNYERQCNKASPPRPAICADERCLVFVRGCVPRATDGACQPPLVVMTSPYCERDPSKIGPNRHHNPLHGRSTVRGLPAELYEAGHKVRLDTGDSMVSVIATEREQAARALVPAPAKPSDPVTSGDSDRPLPRPPAGPVACN